MTFTNFPNLLAEDAAEIFTIEAIQGKEYMSVIQKDTSCYYQRISLSRP